MAAPAKDYKPPPKKHPLDVVRRAKSDFNIQQLIIGFSGGKESVALLDLCSEHFGSQNLFVYFMYMVPGLDFQERYLRYIERRYALSILRIPHWALSRVYRGANFRHPTKKSLGVKNVTIKDVDEYVRLKASQPDPANPNHTVFSPHAWIATGEKAADSLERNAIIRRANGIDANRRRVWPLAWWNDAAVFNRLKASNIALPPEYRQAGKGYAKSFGGLWYRDIIPIREMFPGDWEKIVKHFPLLPAQIERYEANEKRKLEARRGRLIVENDKQAEQTQAESFDGEEIEQGEE